MFQPRQEKTAFCRLFVRSELKTECLCCGGVADAVIEYTGGGVRWYCKECQTVWEYKTFVDDYQWSYWQTGMAFVQIVPKGVLLVLDGEPI